VAKPTGGLTEWFGKGPKGDWVDIGAPKKDGKFQKCGRKSAKSSKRKYPKCVPRAKAKSMTAAQRRSAVRRKRAAGNPGGKPTNVKTILKKKDGGIVSRMHKGCGAVMPNRRKRTKFS
jgi:hypothetical protein|tara:strand:+ start:17 stop:370 length:354 start_codon:yes stop_codon:yes gene_type:complete